MERLRKFRVANSLKLEQDQLKKVDRQDLIEERRKQEDALESVFYINSGFSDLYEEMEILGEGCVGIVRRVIRRSDSAVFACKMVRTNDEEEVVQNVIREFKCQRKLNHQIIVKVYELYVDETKKRIYSIMEFVDAREMFDVISKLGYYSESVAAQIFRDILEGIKYLHASMVCHRDLKPNNILCTADGKIVKITDFNVSKFAHSDNSHKKASADQSKHVLMWTYTGTVAFSAPEIFAGDSYDESVDMWSAGVVLYTMLAGFQPFEAEYVQDLIEKISAAKFDFPDDPFANISDHAKDLIKKCLQVDPKRRLTAVQALKHPWMAVAPLSNTELATQKKNLSQHLKKLISKFAALNALECLRKTKDKRRLTLCTAILFRPIESSTPPPDRGENIVRKSLSPIKARRKTSNQKVSGIEELQMEERQLFLLFKPQVFGVVEEDGRSLSSQRSGCGVSDSCEERMRIDEIDQIKEGTNLSGSLKMILTSPNNLVSCDSIVDDSATECITRKGRKRGARAMTSIIHNRFILNESDQLFLQTLNENTVTEIQKSFCVDEKEGEDYLEGNDEFFEDEEGNDTDTHTFGDSNGRVQQDLSNRNSILCQRILSKIQMSAVERISSIERVNNHLQQMNADFLDTTATSEGSPVHPRIQNMSPIPPETQKYFGNNVKKENKLCSKSSLLTQSPRKSQLYLFQNSLNL